MVFLFPFEHVEHGAKIIIYGAGRVGQHFIQQVKMTGYCTITAVVDKNYQLYSYMDEKVVSPDQLKKIAYDRIVIAIGNKKIAEQIKETLINFYGAEDKQIVLGYERKFEFLEPKRIALNSEPGTNADCKEIRIAFYFSGGLGDVIIAKSAVEELAACLKAPCKVDLYAAPRSIAFVRMIFAQAPFADSFFVGKPSDREYGCVIYTGYLIDIVKFDYDNIHKLDAGFAEKLLEISKKTSAYKSGIEISNRVHFDRCKFSGCTCYTAYRHMGFCMNDWHTDIPLLPEYKDVCREFGNQKYITINYGWGFSEDGAGKPPNKLWPLSYYERFVKLFHDAFPDILLVQVGMKNSARISGADKYIMGEKLESVAHILKRSVLHIDCEGGLVHLASQIGTKCVVLFGPTPAYYFGYPENINIVSEKCQDCYYVYNDFWICAKGLDEPDCMYSIKPGMVMEKVKEYLNSAQRRD